MFRPIYEPRTRAREYSDLAINIYKGCNHGCIYCYARKMAERYTSKNCICSFDKPKVRDGIVGAVKNQLSGGKYRDKKIMLCFTCDPYPAEIDTTPTREIIEVIKDSGNHVQTLTKGGNRALRDFDLLDSGDSFGITISGHALHMAKQEPKAAGFKERLWTLAIAANRGIKTWVSFEPVFDEQTVYDAIKGIDYINFYKIGKLNYYPSNVNWTEQDLTDYNRRQGKPDPGVMLVPKSKYHNNRVKVDGILFDSQKEADKYGELKLQLQAGIIRGFCRQPEFILQAGFGEVKPITYRADFIVFNLDGMAEIIDCKGYENEVFKLKHKMFMERYPRLELKLE